MKPRPVQVMVVTRFTCCIRRLNSLFKITVREKSHGSLLGWKHPLLFKVNHLDGMRKLQYKLLC